MILFFVFQVSRSQFQDYCISHLDSLQSSPDQMREANQDQNHHDSLEDDSEFCDKKLLAINHLYNNSSEAILSVRGTVRGIRNRVRAGIKTFAPEKVTLAAIMVITVKPKWTSLPMLPPDRERVIIKDHSKWICIIDPINPYFQKYF